MIPTNDKPGLSSLIPAVLNSVERAIAQDLAPEITSAAGKAMVDMVRRLVRWSIVEIEQHHVLYAARSAAESLLVDDATAVAAEPDPEIPGLYAVPTPAERRYFREVDLLTATLTRNLSEARDSAVKTTALVARLRRVLEAEISFHGALDPESTADIASAYHGGKSDDAGDQVAQTPLDVDGLNTYLRRRYPDHPDIAARNLEKLTGGMGKDTFLFELTGHAVLAGQLVMRKDLPVLCLDQSAVDEFSLLQAVHAAGVAAPEPLWAETDAQQLGTRFIVVRRARGSVAIAQEIADEDERRHFADMLAKGLADIHSLHLPELEVFRSASTKSMSRCLRDQLQSTREFWQRKRLEPSVKLDIVFAWLDANIPSDTGLAPTLVHGDYGFHNLIMEKGEVTAILDWEFAHMGDPAEDVNYCRQFIDRYVPFEYFLERYLSRGGKPYDATRDRYFTVWRNLRNAVACIGALHAFRSEKSGNIKMATAGLAYNPRFEIEALRLVVQYMETDT